MTLQKTPEHIDNGLADHLARWTQNHIADVSATPLLMVSGAQGIGKSWGLAALRDLLDIPIAVIGLDDVYLPRDARIALSKEVHPLCETRGPAGTHDLNLLKQTVAALKAAGPSSRTRIPTFDKRTDDRRAENEWTVFRGQPRAIIVEGWLMGALADPAAAQSEPINALEAEHDPDGIWRAWQEQHLAQSYADLWQLADGFLHLDAPSFDAVLRWRTEQEETTLSLARGSLPLDRQQWVQRFIQHYERVTRRMLAGKRMPGDFIRVDASRAITGMSNF